MKPLPSQMSRQEFMAAFGDLYEHSPWVAAGVYNRGLDQRLDDQEALHQAFRQVLLDSDRLAKLELLRAHPALACGRRDLTDSSLSEQAGAGLDQCTDQEFQAFKALNSDYLERFGFPFIIAVKGLDRSRILALFRQRINGEPDAEFHEALEQVCLIGKYRLEEWFRE